MKLTEIIDKYKNCEISEKDLFYRDEWPEWKALRIVLTEFQLLYDDKNKEKGTFPYTVLDRDFKLSGYDIMANDWNIYDSTDNN